MASTRRSARERLQARWQGLAAALLGVAVLVGAIVVPGYHVADLHLDEGSIYVSRRGPVTLGQVNLELDRLVQGKRPGESHVDVLQQGSEVYVRSQDTNLLQRWDVVGNQMGAPAQLPSVGQVAWNAQTMAVLAPVTGSIWYGTPDKILSTDFGQAEAQYDARPKARIAVTSKGQALALSVEKNLLVRLPMRQGDKPELIKPPFVVDPEGDVDLSAVGDKAVVLDRRTSQLWIEGETHPIIFEGALAARLAPPTPSRLRIGQHEVVAVVATPAGVLGITDNGSQINLTRGVAQGDPTTPAVAHGCVYGAFGKQVAVACKDGVPKIMDIPDLPANAELAFRVNRDKIVLNDAVSGLVWLVDKDMKIVNDWDQVTTETDTSVEDIENEQIEKAPVDRSKPNVAPTPKADELRVRAGRATMLPVLDNDNDPDGDILTVEKVSKPNVGSVALVRGGTQLQFTAPPGSEGQTAVMTYGITDGRDGHESSTVTVTIVSASQDADNQAPKQRTSDVLRLKSGDKRVQLRVLSSWRDPEGDDLFLVNAEMDGTDDEVSFTPDGLITYNDVANSEGAKTIKVTVSDGRATSTGKVQLVVGPEPGPAIVNGDYYSTGVGNEVVVAPLANDVGAQYLALSNVGKSFPAGGTIAASYSDNTFRFKADNPGTYYVDYVATTGPNVSGVVRIDVLKPAGGGSPPVAVRDVAMLPAAGEVLVDPLLNDEDADGDVLAIQSISADPRLEVQMQDRHLLTIRSRAAAADPITLTYKVSDGRTTVDGTLVVIPSTPKEPRPVAIGDELRVRANDTGTVNVLANDFSPVGQQLTLERQLVDSSGGMAWVDGPRIRFQAPPQPGVYRVTYRIHDAEGRSATNSVRVTVATPEAENRPPVPVTVTGRVLAGQHSPIMIPLDGIDPNGDSVRLLGLASGPRLGRIVGVGDRYLEYEAYDKSRGTDTFTYEVIDTRGARATATIKVGIIPPGDSNSDPIAIDDKLTARPGRTVRLPLLHNDMDPDGTGIELVVDKLQLQTATGTKIEPRVLDGRDIEFTLPSEPVSVIGSYVIVDGGGARAMASIKVNVLADAPLLAPVARDDLVAAIDVIGKTQVDVAVLTNDYDPDGNIDDVTIDVPAYQCQPDTCAHVVDGANQAGVPAGQRVIRAFVGPQMQLIRYTVTDADGNVSTAVLIVPGANDSIPALKKGVAPKEVMAGSTVQIELGDYIEGTEGRKVMLVSEQNLWPTYGSANANSGTSIKYTASTDARVGPASVVAEVTDGKSPADETGRRAVLTIPITITARPQEVKPGETQAKPLNSPPETQPLTLTLFAGEGRTSLDLLKGAKDPDNNALSFDKPNGADPPGVRVTWENSHELVGEADLKAEPGTRTRYTTTVHDSEGATAPMVIDVVVMSSSKPRAATTDDIVSDAVQGREVVSDVLANDVNPFPQAQPLKVESVVVEAGSPSSGPSTDGTTVRVTPAADFVGSMVLRYTVSDATGEKARNVDGRVRITVRGVPTAPGVPTIADASNMNRQVTISFRDSIDNGAPVQYYEVTAVSDAGQTVVKRCPATTCTIDGLVNGHVYRMSVIAHNEVGDSLPSNRSGEMRPDTKPGQPDAPAASKADKQSVVTWTPPFNEGSPIKYYELRVTGAGMSPTVTNVGPATTYTVGNLTNGTQYSFEVRAVNQSDMASEWSPAIQQVPAGPPLPEPVVTSVKGSEEVGNLAYISYTPAGENGSAIKGYEVSYSIGGASPITRPAVASGENEFVLDKIPNGELTVTIRAENGMGWSAWSEPRTVMIFGPPGTTSPLKYEYPEVGATSALVTLKAAEENGAPVTSYEVMTYAGDKARVAPMGAADATAGTQVVTVSGLTIGEKYNLSFRACAMAGGFEKCSAWSDAWANTLVPFDTPEPPEPRLLALPGDKGGVKVELGREVGAVVNGATVTKVTMAYPGGSTSATTSYCGRLVSVGCRTGEKLTFQTVAEGRIDGDKQEVQSESISLVVPEIITVTNPVGPRVGVTAAAMQPETSVTCRAYYQDQLLGASDPLPVGGDGIATGVITRTEVEGSEGKPVSTIECVNGETTVFKTF